MENNSELFSADAGLHEFVDLELVVPTADTAAKEKALSDALKDLPTVRKLSIAKGKISLQYEAAALSAEDVRKAIGGAGFEVSESESAPSSALTDAFLEAREHTSH